MPGRVEGQFQALVPMDLEEPEAPRWARGEAELLVPGQRELPGSGQAAQEQGAGKGPEDPAQAGDRVAEERFPFRGLDVLVRKEDGKVAHHEKVGGPRPPVKESSQVSTRLTSWWTVKARATWSRSRASSGSWPRRRSASTRV